VGFFKGPVAEKWKSPESEYDSFDLFIWFPVRYLLEELSGSLRTDAMFDFLNAG